MKKLVIIGASGHGKVIADLAEQTHKYEEINFLDDNRLLHGSPFAKGKVIGDTQLARALIKEKEYDFFIAIGNAEIREKITEELLGYGAEIPVLIHPFSSIADDVIIGAGTAVMAGAVINAGSRIGKGVIINTCASVDHDNVISDYVHVSVGAHTAGSVKIGKYTWIGIGAVVSNNLSVTDHVVLGAGAVVVKNIDTSGTYIGVPAKRHG